MGAADRLHAGLGEAEVLHLAFADQVLHRAGDVFDRHVRIDAMLVEEIDDVGPQPLERSLGDRLDVLRPAVEAAACACGPISKPNLVAITTSLAQRRERLADQLLVGERAVDLRGVEEGDAAFDRGADSLIISPRVRRRSVGVAHAHAAEADGRDLQTAIADFALLHCQLRSHPQP